MTLGLATIKDEVAFETRWELLMAASVILTIPMVILFFLAQRYFIEGVATQARKG